MFLTPANTHRHLSHWYLCSNSVFKNVLNTASYWKRRFMILDQISHRFSPIPLKGLLEILLSVKEHISSMKASFVRGFSMINMAFELNFKEVSVFLSLSSSHPHWSKKPAQTHTVLCEQNTDDSPELLHFPKALNLNTTLNSNAPSRLLIYCLQKTWSEKHMNNPKKRHQQIHRVRL